MRCHARVQFKIATRDPYPPLTNQRSDTAFFFQPILHAAHCIYLLQPPHIQATTYSSKPNISSACRYPLFCTKPLSTHFAALPHLISATYHIRSLASHLATPPNSRLSVPQKPVVLSPIPSGPKLTVSRRSCPKNNFICTSLARSLTQPHFLARPQ